MTHVVLRERRPTDLPALARWLTDSGAEWRRWDAPYTPASQTDETMQAYLAYMGATPPENDEQLVEVDGAVVGLVSRSQEDPAGGGWWDLGILIFDPAYWNKGVGTRALGLWVQDTFDWTDAHVVTVTTWSGNARMIRSAQKLGFQECMRVRQSRLYQGERYDSVRLDLLRAEWRGVP